MLRAGILRDRITIQRRLPGGGLGQPSNTWEDALPGPIWANIRFGSGSESIRAGQIASKAQASIRVRKRAGITAEMRAVCDGVIYAIKAVLPDHQHREYMDLVCEVTNG
ncbi:phage head closure protein [Comamonas terrigena]|uniref:phage head closure protein n=1 Tax=Comamonas terrigena TaxID=32013 RepID=UPI00289C92FC|nr:phage head closure protein [Comamonas terrigena]